MGKEARAKEGTPRAGSDLGPGAKVESGKTHAGVGVDEAPAPVEVLDVVS